MDLETLEIVKDDDSLLKCFEDNVKRIPDNNWMGTQVNGAYEWITFKEAEEIADALSQGIVSLNLHANVSADDLDKSWKFLGI